MKLTGLTQKERVLYDYKVKAGEGEIIAIKYVEVEEQEIIDSPPHKEKVTLEGGKETEIEVPAVSHTDYVAVPREAEYYVGCTTLGILGNLVSVVGVAIANGASVKQAYGIKNNVPFLEALGGTTLSDMVSVVLEEDPDFVFRYIGWPDAIKVVKAFFKYNPFFEVAQQVLGGLEGMGITEEKVRSVLLGETPAPAPTQAEEKAAE